MKITKLRITKINKNNMRNGPGMDSCVVSSVCLEAEITKGENLIDARLELEKEIDKLILLDSRKYRIAKQIIDDPYNFSGKEIENAKAYIAQVEGK